jgi:Protein of unknown function (DUF3631)
MSAVLLDDVCKFLRRFVVMSDIQTDASALWTAHTHAIEAAEATPYLAVTSAVKGSGKSRLREALELIVSKPLSSANMSDAALFRAIATMTPTLLLDEADAIFKAREREDLRGLLNAGYRRGAVTYRIGGANKTTLESFPVFGAKAFFGIGDFLPDTLADRAIAIRLQKRIRGEEAIDRFRQRLVTDDGAELRDRLADWLEPQLDVLRAAWPALPDELDDRAQDSWEPLLAIADLAGGNWPERALRAAVELSTGDEREDDSLSVQLLRDIHTVFTANGNDARLRTLALLEGLHAIEESPWGDYYGKPLSANVLSRLLKPYRVKTMPVWHDGQTVRGYKLEQFDEPFARVLGVRRVRSVRSEAGSQAAPNAPNAQDTNKPLIVVGDDGYIDLLDRALAGGHITDHERRERRRLHFTLRRAGAVAA